MKKDRLFLLLQILALLFTSCDGGGMCLEGEEDVETRTLDIARFEGVNVNGRMQVFVRNGSPQQVEVKGQPNVLDQLETRVQGGVFRSDEFDASVSGSGDMKLRIAVNRLSSRLSGSGAIMAAGVADQQEVSVSGSGNYNCFDLTTKEAEIDISGSGKAEVNVQNRLDVDIGGSGRVYHQGNPPVNADISGSGKVIKK